MVHHLYDDIIEGGGPVVTNGSVAAMEEISPSLNSIPQAIGVRV